MFQGCRKLKLVSFGKASRLEEIGPHAFYGCGLESFAAPSSLRRIGAMAFGACSRLRDFQLNQNIREIGQMCFWMTRITKLSIPKQVMQTPAQLGLDQKTPGVLRLLDDFEATESGQFMCSDVEKVIVSSGVRDLGHYTFCGCHRLREIIFEPGSRLESIGYGCFAECALEGITIPSSVTSISEYAFYNSGSSFVPVLDNGSPVPQAGLRPERNNRQPLATNL